MREIGSKRATDVWLQFVQIHLDYIIVVLFGAFISCQEDVLKIICKYSDISPLCRREKSI